MLAIDIISPEGALFSAECDMVIIPAEAGDMGILAGHIPTIATMRAGNLILFDKGKAGKQFFLSGGFADITQDKVTILANEAQDSQMLKASDLEKTIKSLQEDSRLIKNMKDDAERNNQLAMVEEKINIAEAALRSLNEKYYT